MRKTFKYGVVGLLSLTALFVAERMFGLRGPVASSSENDAPRQAAAAGGTVMPADDCCVWQLTGAIDSLAWSPDGKTLAIQTKPGPTSQGHAPGASDTSSKIQLWNVSEGRLDHVLHETDDDIFSVEFSPDGKSLACAAWARTGLLARLAKKVDRPFVSEVRLWEVATGELTQTLKIADDDLGAPISFDLLAIAFSPDGKQVAAGGKLVSASNQHGHGMHVGGEICLWDLPTGELKWRNATVHTDIVYDVVFSPDGRLLASGGMDKLVRFHDPESGELKKTLFGVAWDGLEGLTFSRDGGLLASTGLGREEGGHTRVWDVESGRLLKTIWGSPESPIARLAFSPVAERLVGLVLPKEGEKLGWQLRVFDPRTGQAENLTSIRPGGARLLRISPDGKSIAISTWDHQVVVCKIDAE